MGIRRTCWRGLQVFLLLAAVAAVGGGNATAAELKPDTLRAWEAYLRPTEARISRELSSNTRFLALDFQSPTTAAAERREVLAGEVTVTKIESLGPDGQRIVAVGGMIHHWRGSIFIPGVELEYLLDRVRNPVSEEIKQEDVLRSEVLERGDNYLKLYLKLQRSKIVTVVYNTEHEVRYRERPDGRAWSSSKAVKIAEVAEANTPNEFEKPEGRDHGFLWRLNSYWRYEPVKGGVIVECESVSLSRSIPSFLAVLVRPIIDRVARESMERTLVSLRDRTMRGSHAQVAQRSTSEQR